MVEEEKAASPLPPGCLAPIVWAVVLFAILAGVCTFSVVSNLGDPTDKPSPAYETCVEALRTAGFSERDPGWLSGVGACMERLTPSTTRRR